MATTTKIEQLRTARGEFPQYSNVGGYTILYLTETDDALCAACVNGENGSLVGDDSATDDPEWTIVTADIYWEGPVIQCDHCNADIESSYGDPDSDDS